MFAKDLFKQPQAQVAAALFALGGVINATVWFLTLTRFPQDDVAAVLHYNIATGIDLIGEGAQITMLPTAGLIILLGNGILGAALLRESRPAAWILWSALPVVQLTLLGAFLLIWQAN